MGECNHRWQTDDARWETYCEICGLVAPKPEPLDAPPYSLGFTQFGDQLDVSTPKRATKALRRIQATAWRNRRRPRRERTIRAGSVLLARAGGLLDIPPTVIQESISLYRRAAQFGLAQGRSTTALVAAVLLAVSRQTRYPRTLTEVCKVTGTSSRRMRKALSLLRSQFGLRIRVPQASAYLGRFAFKFGVPKKAELEANAILRALEKRAPKASPSGVAAAALYAAQRGDLPWNRVQNVTGLSRRTIIALARLVPDEPFQDDQPDATG